MIFQAIGFFAVFGAIGVEGAAPVVLPFNDTHTFGFDGPWQAVPILVGQPPQLINLYPGGNGPISVLSKNIPANFTELSYDSVSGVYDASLAQTFSQKFSETGQTMFADSGWGAGPTLPTVGNGAVAFTDNVSHKSFGSNAVINTFFAAVVDTSYQIPDGREFPQDVGFLSLGGRDYNSEGLNGTTIPSYLFKKGVTRSNTWGLHIGSVLAKIPGSLVFGGYDSGRVIGDVRAAAQNEIGDMFVSLIDISIGVALGASPFPFQKKDGLLLDRGNSSAPLRVRPNPTVPYLHLPENTCQSIAALLPVKYSPSIGLYLWDTDSPQYESMISSPAFLAFAFEQVGSLDNLTIKVPFYLLNLTLSPPLVPKAVPYFPCRPYEFEEGSPFEHHLGRAFLQAAFIGMNWNAKTWWMAQAPGPKLPPSTITSLENSSSIISAKEGQPYWTSTWESVWTPLAERGGSDVIFTEPSSPKSSGISPEAKAGATLGAVAGALMISGAVLFLLLRRLRKRRGVKNLQMIARRSHIDQNGQDLLDKAELPSRSHGLASRMQRHEMPATNIRHEMSAPPTNGRQQSNEATASQME